VSQFLVTYQFALAGANWGFTGVSSLAGEDTPFLMINNHLMLYLNVFDIHPQKLTAGVFRFYPVISTSIN
jgi:hypothetical protein